MELCLENLNVTRHEPFFKSCAFVLSASPFCGGCLSLQKPPEARILRTRHSSGCAEGLPGPLCARYTACVALALEYLHIKDWTIVAEAKFWIPHTRAGSKHSIFSAPKQQNTTKRYDSCTTWKVMLLLCQIQRQDGFRRSSFETWSLRMSWSGAVDCGLVTTLRESFQSTSLLSNPLVAPTQL